MCSDPFLISSIAQQRLLMVRSNFNVSSSVMIVIISILMSVTTFFSQDPLLEGVGFDVVLGWVKWTERLLKST